MNIVAAPLCFHMTTSINKHGGRSVSSRFTSDWNKLSAAPRVQSTCFLDIKEKKNTVISETQIES